MTRRRFERLMMGAGHSADDARFLSQIGVEWCGSYQTAFDLCRDTLIKRYSPYKSKIKNQIHDILFGLAEKPTLPKELRRGENYDRLNGFIGKRT